MFLCGEAELSGRVRSPAAGFRISELLSKIRAVSGHSPAIARR
jgi:hypothetical protein